MNRYDVFDTQEKTQIGHGMTGKEVKKAVGSATINVSSYATANCLISGRYRVEIAYFEPSEKWRERFETSWQQVTEKLRCSGVDLSEISITEGD